MLESSLNNFSLLKYRIVEHTNIKGYNLFFIEFNSAIETCRGHNPSQRNQSLEEDYIEQGQAVKRTAILKIQPQKWIWD